MSLARDHHRYAMHLAEKALEAKAAGDFHQAGKLFRDALEYERHAAETVASSQSPEPTRSVLYRSAATLALDGGEYREAERLIACGLMGNPPEEIAEELRMLFDQVNLHRHLDLRGVELDRTELQLSIAGNAVGPGITSATCFLERLQSIERLVYRTAERKRHQPFRERGTAKETLKRDFEIFLSAPRAASFAVTVKLGRQRDQLALPDTQDTQEVIADLMRCLDLFGRSDEKALRNQIPDEAYYRNFVGLARRMAPDGDEVTLVGLTAIRHGTEKSTIALSRPANEYPAIDSTKADRSPEERVTISGELLFADALGRQAAGKIRILDEQGATHQLSVPKGMMADIVRPLWQETVVVSGRQSDKGILVLEDIKRVERF